MKSYPTNTSFGRKLTFAAVVLLNTGSAFAATTADDAQARAQTLLSGSPAARVDTGPSLLSATATFESTLEPQEQARRLLAGKTTSSNFSRDRAPGTTAAASVQAGGSAYVEAQEAARRMILGKGA